ncbi:MAG: Mur ligase family protein [Bryobacterales bacterium]|nr:Mur ligase family protein [Bryobacterales bacterium]
MERANAPVDYLFSLLGSIRKESFGLHRMQRLMAELGHPERAAGIVHIAGTNGKGSTAAMIESGLRAAGCATGLYTSPHLSRIHERFLLNGLPVSDAALAAAIEPVRRASERIVASHGRGVHPTFFESVSAVGLMLFEQAGSEYRIVETGLGGRLDASNVVRPELAVLTRVGCDHEQYLGRGLARIAAEKGAIVKPGCRAVIAPQEREAREVLLRCCADACVGATDVAKEWQVRDAKSEKGCWKFAAISGEKRIQIDLALAGQHQVENALTAAAALTALGIPSRSIETGIRSTIWPGRLEFAKRDPRVLLDAAHNPNGARALARFLDSEARGRKVTLIYGSSRDKPVDEIAGWMFPAADRVVLTRSRVQRSATPGALLQATGHHHARIETAPGIEAALRMAAADSGSDDWIVVTGSLFLVGEARELLG